MSEPIQKDRSPRSPSATLQESIALTGKLFDAIRTASVSPDVAVKPLGYGSTNGAAMTVLATLSQYGLIDRSGGKIAVSSLAVQILHPRGEDQRLKSIREAALSSRIMKELHDGYSDCAESVITGHLVQSGFSLERANRLASIHVSNKEFAKLFSEVTDQPLSHEAHDKSDEKKQELTFGHPDISSKEKIEQTEVTVKTDVPLVSSLIQKMLAQYSIPLGSNSAQLIFTGEKLVPDDFDALIEYVELFKKQFERAQKGVAAAKAAFAAPVIEEVPPTRETSYDAIAFGHPLPKPQN